MTEKATLQTLETKTGVRITVPAGLGIRDQALAIFVHGVWGTARLWAPWFHRLPHGVIPVAIDVPGYGGTTIDDSALETRTLDTWSGYVLSVIDEFAPRSCYLIGESTGGAAVLRAAGLAPERVSACVAITTPFRGGAVSDTLGVYPALARTGGVQAMSDFMMARLGLEDAEPRLRSEIRAAQLGCRPEVVLRDAGLWEDADLGAVCAAVRCPVLVLAPGSSPILSREASFALERLLPDAEFVLVGSGRHYMAFTHPAIPAAVTCAFLEGVQSASGQADDVSQAQHVSGAA